MIYDHRQGVHDSLGVVLRYAMPNVNAGYRADRIDATRWEGDYPVCAACGTSKGPFEVHHEPERSKGSLLLRTAMGQFVVKPALLLLCKACHDERTARVIQFDWEFDNPGEQKRFLTGWFFAHGYDEHDHRLYRHGKIVVRRRGEVVREIREGVWYGLPTIAEIEAEYEAQVKRSERIEAAYERIGWTGGIDG